MNEFTLAHICTCTHMCVHTYIHTQIKAISTLYCSVCTLGIKQTSLPERYNLEMEKLGAFKTAYQVGNCSPSNGSSNEERGEKHSFSLGRKSHAVPVNESICFKEGQFYIISPLSL